MKKYIDTRIKQEQERVGEHNKIPFERYMHIRGEALRRMRSETKRNGIDKNGEFDDFVEVRRPFIAPNNESAPN